MEFRNKSYMDKQQQNDVFGSVTGFAKRKSTVQFADSGLYDDVRDVKRKEDGHYETLRNSKRKERDHSWKLKILIFIIFTVSCVSLILTLVQMFGGSRFACVCKTNEEKG